MKIKEEFNFESKKKPIFSIIAIVMPFIFFGVMYIFDQYNLADHIDRKYEYHVIGGIILLYILGMISLIISFFRRESNSTLKWAGALINAAVVIFYVFIIFFD
ncbi:MAG: putative membrane protein [Halioglobus sp.]|jgi:uncharacterized membrane protein